MIESLPEELLIEILLCLSADDIYDNARLVCRRWRYLIHTDAFVREHLHRTSSGLVLQPLSSGWHSPIFVTATMQGRVETSNSSCRTHFQILSSCNGLALCSRDDGSWPTPFILNPATKCAFNLPSLSEYHRFGMVYAAASMAYKVVGLTLSVEQYSIFILTVGVDETWRYLSTNGLSSEKDLWNAPLTIGGCFLHWVTQSRVVSLNVETETFTVTPTPALMFPPDYQERKRGYYVLSTGEYLSLLIRRGDWSWEVWEMKPETWEWRKVLPNLDLEAHKCKIQQLSSHKGDVLNPVGWVRYPQVLAFLFVSKDRSCIFYNLGTKEIESIELSTTVNYHRAVQHRSSLLWLEKC